jgi:predicted MFS family arabinose efflux permease
VSLELLLLLQFCAGFAGVVLMSVTFAFISQRTAKDSYFALFIASQMATGALATLLVERIAGDDGARTIFGFLAFCAAAAIPLVLLMPRESAAAPEEPRGLAGAVKLVASPGSLAVLATQVLFGAGIMLIWSYAARIGEGHGLPRAAVAGALSFSLLSSIVGALSASALGRRIRVDASLMAGTALIVAAAALATHADEAGAFFLAIALFGFGWNFIPPFQLGIAADIDPSGRLVVLNIALVKLGYAVGAASGGLLAARGGYELHAVAASTCYIAALLTALLARNHSLALVRSPRL